MIIYIINALKIIFLLGFLILIHELGHFLVAKWCKVTVHEFAIGFGKKIFQKEYKNTRYVLRLIPLGGFVSMEGEEENSENEGSFSKVSILKRMSIVVAGAAVNIIFGLLVYFVIISFFGISFSDPNADTFLNRMLYGGAATLGFAKEAFGSFIGIFMHGLSTDQMMGPVGISNVIIQNVGIIQYVYILAVISISLGITNLLPIPGLDGGKIIVLLIEAIRRKPMKQETEASLVLLGMSFIICLAIYVTYNDIIRIF